MKISILILFIFLSITSSAKVRSSLELAKALEDISNQLSPADPQRQEVNLRLADLFFEASLEIDKTADSKELKNLSFYRGRSLQYYQRAISGHNGAFSKPSALQTIKIEFQMAKLLFDLNQDAAAQALWKKLSQQNQIPEIQREAALKLAEQKENSSVTQELVEARKLYLSALKTANSDEMKSYIQYRISWIEYRMGQSKQAVQTLLESLSTAHPQSVEQMTKDYVLFLAHSPYDAKESIERTENVEKKFQQKNLVLLLMGHYRSNDSRDKFAYSLKYLQIKSPQMNLLIDILEQNYLDRNIKAMQNTTEQIQKSASKDLGFSSAQEKNESEKVLFRNLLLLDGERQAQPQFTELFQSLSVSYMIIFSNSPQIEKVLNGYLFSFGESSKQLAQLHFLIEKQIPLAILREKRMSLAQVNGQLDLVASDAQILLTKKPKDRKLKYILAKARYDQKKDDALQLLLDLANENTQADEITFFAMNLSLDLLAQQKKYSEIQKWTSLWIKNPRLRETKQGPVELAKFKEIQEKSVFENAVVSNNAQSLIVFKDYCQSGKYEKTACDNAKQMALEQKNLPVYFSILKRENNLPVLAAEYERFGYFNEAADIYSKILPAQDITTWLKVGFLYDLGQNISQRNIAYTKATQIFSKKTNLSEAEQLLLLNALVQSSILEKKHVSLPWSEANRLSVALGLEAKGDSTAATRKALLASCKNHGPLWQNLQIDSLNELYLAQNKMKFTGAQSQKKFKARVQILEQMDERTTCYTSVTTANEKTKPWAAMAFAYKEFSEEILATPLPAELPAEMIPEVKAQLQTMAEPFQKRSQEYSEISKTSVSEFQLAKVEVPNDKLIQLDSKQIQPLVEKMKLGKTSPELLIEIETELKKTGHIEAAAYFRARSNQEKKEAAE